MGSRGGGGAAAIQSAPQVEDVVENVTWRPPRGLGKEAFWALLLEREGITMQQVKDDPELRADLNAKYKYLVDEGYVTW